MKKKKIQFLMIQDEHKTSFESIGSFERNQLTFIDYENQKNSILFKENKVEYIKIGDKFMHYSFEENKRTKGLYRVDQFEFVFQIHTTYMKHTNEQLQINFTLHQDEDIVGHHELKIVYKDYEEDFNGL